MTALTTVFTAVAGIAGAISGGYLGARLGDKIEGGDAAGFIMLIASIVGGAALGGIAATMLASSLLMNKAEQSKISIQTPPATQQALDTGVLTKETVKQASSTYLEQLAKEQLNKTYQACIKDPEQTKLAGTDCNKYKLIPQ